MTLLALQTIQEKRKKLQAALERLDQNERNLKIKLGMPVGRERSTKEEIEDIRARILSYMETHHSDWTGIEDIANAVTSVTDHDDSTVRTQIHTLAHDTETNLIHNGERGRGSMYVYVCDGNPIPENPAVIQRRRAWVINSLRSLRDDGKLLCTSEEILEKLHEHEGLQGITHTDLQGHLEYLLENTDGKLRRDGDKYLYIG